LTRFVLKNPLLDFRVLRCRRERTLRGVDLAECIATARRIRPAEISSWHSGWVRTTEDAAHLAEGAEQAGEGATARARVPPRVELLPHRWRDASLPAAWPRLQKTNALQNQRQARTTL
jgi:hypothetical protein